MSHHIDLLHSVWEVKGNTFMVKDVGESVDGDITCVLTDGIKIIVATEDELVENHTQVTDLVRLRPFEYTMQLSAGSMEETQQLFHMVSVNAMEICNRGVVPFEEVVPGTTGNVKEHITQLSYACGVWTRAMVFLDTQPAKEEGGEPTLVISIALQGLYFLQALKHSDKIIENEGSIDGIYYFDMKFRTADNTRDAIGRVINSFDVDICEYLDVEKDAGDEKQVDVSSAE